jgi:hypothetical protein
LDVTGDSAIGFVAIQTLNNASSGLSNYFAKPMPYTPHKYIVTTSVDDYSSVGTLRWAIGQVNTYGSSTQADTIAFADTLTVPAIINLDNYLPAISKRVILDATRLTTYSGTPLITINGKSMFGQGLGLTSGASGSRIAGLAFQNFVYQYEPDKFQGASLFLSNVDSLNINRCKFEFGYQDSASIYRVASISISNSNHANITSNIFEADILNIDTIQTIGVYISGSNSESVNIENNLFNGFSSGIQLSEVGSDNSITGCVFSRYTNNAININSNNIGNFQIYLNQFRDTLAVLPVNLNVVNQIDTPSINLLKWINDAKLTIQGTSTPNAVIDIYHSNKQGQALELFESVIANSTGEWSLEKTITWIQSRGFTAIQTIDGMSSQLSNWKEISTVLADTVNIDMMPYTQITLKAHINAANYLWSDSSTNRELTYNIGSKTSDLISYSAYDINSQLISTVVYSINKIDGLDCNIGCSNRNLAIRAANDWTFPCAIAPYTNNSHSTWITGTYINPGSGRNTSTGRQLIGNISMGGFGVQNFLPNVPLNRAVHSFDYCSEYLVSDGHVQGATLSAIIGYNDPGVITLPIPGGGGNNDYSIAWLGDQVNTNTFGFAFSAYFNSLTRNQIQFATGPCITPCTQPQPTVELVFIANNPVATNPLGRIFRLANSSGGGVCRALLPSNDVTPQLADGSAQWTRLIGCLPGTATNLTGRFAILQIMTPPPYADPANPGFGNDVAIDFIELYNNSPANIGALATPNNIRLITTQDQGCQNGNGQVLFPSAIRYVCLDAVQGATSYTLSTAQPCTTNFQSPSPSFFVNQSFSNNCASVNFTISPRSDAVGCGNTSSNTDFNFMSLNDNASNNFYAYNNASGFPMYGVCSTATPSFDVFINLATTYTAASFPASYTFPAGSTFTLEDNGGNNVTSVSIGISPAAGSAPQLVPRILPLPLGTIGTNINFIAARLRISITSPNLLTDGRYNLVYTEFGNTMSIPIEIYIVDPPVCTASVTDICQGQATLTYSFTGFSGYPMPLTPGLYDYQVTIAGTGFTTQTLNNQIPGTYTRPIVTNFSATNLPPNPITWTITIAPRPAIQGNPAALPNCGNSVCTVNPVYRDHFITLEGVESRCTSSTSVPITSSITPALPSSATVTYRLDGTVITLPFTPINLTSGPHSVEARVDDNGCISTQTNYFSVVQNPSAPSVTPYGIGCRNSTNAVVVVNSPLNSEYSYNGGTFTGSTSYVVPITSPPTTTVSVVTRVPLTGVAGSFCVSAPTTVTIPASVTPISATVPTSSSYCSNAIPNYATICATPPSGGQAPFTYQWTFPATPTGANIVGSSISSCVNVRNSSGTTRDYTLTITDANGCTWTGTTRVTSVSESPSINVNPSYCAGSGPMAGLSFTPSGGQLNLISNGSASQFTSPYNAPSSAGNYTLEYTATSGQCTFKTTKNFTVVASPAQPATTFDCETKRLTIVSPTGSGLTYSIDGSTFSGATSAILGGSFPRTVSVSVRNGNCTTSVNVPVAVNNSTVTVSASTTQFVLCTQATNSIDLGFGGNISISPSSGSYSYAWSSNPSGQIITGGTTLHPEVNQPGVYTLFVTPTNNGCPVSTSITVLSDNLTTPTITLTNPTGCNNVNANGSIVFSTISNYQYSIDGGATWQTTTTFNNLVSGLYKPAVKSGNCIKYLPDINLWSKACYELDAPCIINTCREGSYPYCVYYGGTSEPTNATYQWSISNSSGTFAGSSTTKCVNINWTNGVLQGGASVRCTVTVSGTQTVLVWGPSPAQCAGAAYNLTANSITNAALLKFVNGGNATVSAGSNNLPGNPCKLSISGTFTVNTNITLRAFSIQMAQDAKIVVNPGYTLTLDNRTFLYACGSSYWDKIENNGTVLVTDSYIENAKTAVEGSNTGKIRSINSCYNENDRHLVTLRTDITASPDGAISGEGPFYLQGNQFRCDRYLNMGSYNNNRKQTQVGVLYYFLWDNTVDINTILVQKPYFKVGVNDNMASSQNVFQNMRFGVVAAPLAIGVGLGSFSNVASVLVPRYIGIDVYNNKFRNLILLPNDSKAEPTTAVQLRWMHFNGPLENGLPRTTEKFAISNNKFDNMGVGVHVNVANMYGLQQDAPSDFNLDVNSNQFVNINGEEASPAYTGVLLGEVLGSPSGTFYYPLSTTYASQFLFYWGIKANVGFNTFNKSSNGVIDNTGGRSSFILNTFTSLNSFFGYGINIRDVRRKFQTLIGGNSFNTMYAGLSSSSLSPPPNWGILPVSIPSSVNSYGFEHLAVLNNFTNVNVGASYLNAHLIQPQQSIAPLGLRFYDNTVHNQYGGGVGVQLQNTDYSRVYRNKFLDPKAGRTSMGINVVNNLTPTQRHEVRCNTVRGYTRGITGRMVNALSTVKSNGLYKNESAIVLNQGRLGNQGDGYAYYYNGWTGNRFATESINSDGSASWFVVPSTATSTSIGQLRPEDGSATKQTGSNAVNPPVSAYINPMSAPSLVGLYYSTNPTLFQACETNDNPPRGGREIQMSEGDLNLYVRLMQDSLTFPDYDASQKAEMKLGIFRALHGNDSLQASSAFLDSFYVSQYDSAIGLIVRAEEQLSKHITFRAAEGDTVVRIDPDKVTSGQALLNQITTDNVVLGNYYSVYSILAAQMADDRDTLSPEEQSILNPIAEDCPIRAGSSIFYARAMLFPYHGAYEDNEPCFEGAGKNTPPKPKKPQPAKLGSQDSNVETDLAVKSIFRIYPNPANETLNIGYENILEGTEVRLLNLLGVSIRNTSLNGKTGNLQWEIGELPAGIYYLQIFKDETVIAGQKILISR